MFLRFLVLCSHERLEGSLKYKKRQEHNWNVKKGGIISGRKLCSHSIAKPLRQIIQNVK